MKTLNKKLLLTSLSSVMIAAPVVTLVACGEGDTTQRRYDTTNDGKIVMHASWSTGSDREVALQGAMQKYNDVMKDEEGFMPVSLNKSTTYGEMAPSYITAFNNKQTTGLPNLFLDYPEASAQMAQYGMEIDFVEAGFDPTGIIDEELLGISNDVARVTDGKIINVPFALSGEILSFNKPLMKTAFEYLAKLGATISADAQNPIVQEIQAQVVSDGDLTTIVKAWNGDANATHTTPIRYNAAYPLGTYVIDDSIFDTYEGIIELATHVNEMFTNESSQAKFFGLDSQTNALYVIAQSMATDDSDTYAELVSENTATSFVDYKLFTDDKATKTFKDASKILIDGINKKGVFIPDGGDYSSGYSTKHLIGISLGSTAGSGYQSSREADELNDSEVIIKEGILGGKKGGSKVAFPQGPSIIGIHANEAEDKAAMKFVQWMLASETNLDFTNTYEKPYVKDGQKRIVTGDDSTTALEMHVADAKGSLGLFKNGTFENKVFATAADAGTYDAVLTDPTDATKFVAGKYSIFAESLPSTIDASKYDEIAITKKDGTAFSATKKLYIVDATATEMSSFWLEVAVATGPQGDKVATFLNGTHINSIYKQGTDASVYGKYNVAIKNAADNTKFNVVEGTDGPYIYYNEDGKLPEGALAGDYTEVEMVKGSNTPAIAKFWIVKNATVTKRTVIDAVGSGTPAALLQKEMGYVLPLNGFTDANSATRQLIASISNDDGLKVGLDATMALISSRTSDTTKIYSAPVDEFTGALRNAIDAAINGAKNNPATPDSIFNGLKSIAKTQKWI